MSQLLLILFLISIKSASAFDIAECLESLETLSTQGQENVSDLLAVTERRNCFQENLYIDAVDGRNLEPLCSECKREFFPNHTQRQDEQLRNTAKARAYVNILYKELQKSITASLIDVVAQRSLPGTQSNYTNSINACSTSTFTSQLQNCPGLRLANVSPSEISSRIGFEVANLLDSRAHNNRGLIARDSSSANTCGVSEAETTRAMALAVEELLTPDKIQKILELSPTSDHRQFEIQLADKLPNFASELRYHPILSALKQDSRRFLQFFRSLPRTSNPQQLTAALRQSLYTPENGNMLDQDLSQRCSRAFSVFRAKVCDPRTNISNVDLGIDNFRKLNDSPAWSDSLVATGSLINENLNLLSYCPPEQISRTTNSMDSVIDELLGNMSPDEKRYSFANYANERFGRQIRSPQERICGILNGTSQVCEPLDSVICKMQSMVQASGTDVASRRRFLSAPTDPAMNNVLRSFVGSPENLTPEVRQVLISQGVLPRENGTFQDPPQPSSTTALANAGGTTGSSGGGQAQGAGIQSRQQASNQQAQIAGDRGRQRRQLSDGFRSTPNDVGAGDVDETYDSEQAGSADSFSDSQGRNIDDEIARRIAEGSDRPEPGQAQGSSNRRERRGRRVPASTTTTVDPLAATRTAAQAFQPTGAGGGFQQGSAQLGDDLESEADNRERRAMDRTLEQAQAGRTASGAAGGGGSGGGTSLSSGAGQENERVVGATSETVSLELPTGQLDSNLQRVLSSKITPELNELRVNVTVPPTQRYELHFRKNGDVWEVVPNPNLPRAGATLASNIRNEVARLYQEALSRAPAQQRGRNFEIETLREKLSRPGQ